MWETTVWILTKNGLPLEGYHALRNLTNREEAMKWALWEALHLSRKAARERGIPHGSKASVHIRLSYRPTSKR
jgi:hypothetical protein